MSITLTHVKGPEVGSPNKQLHESDISVPLPAVLGRGALLKCAEKKVSRRHATLDWDDDDGVIINSVNANPTFVIVSGKKQKLSQGESVVLSHGDKFGLLEDAFWFRVTLEISTKSCDKENALINNSGSKSGHDTNKESKSIQENRNDSLNQNKQIIIDKENNELEKSNCEDNEINVKSKECITKNIFREEVKRNTSSQVASTSNQALDSSNQTCTSTQEASTSNHGSAKVSVTLYSQKDLDAAVNDRKRTLPMWMSGSASSSNKATSSKKDSSNAVQHGRKNKAIPKEQNASRLKEDSSIKNSDNVGEKGKKNKRGTIKSPSKNNISKYHGMSQNDDEEMSNMKKGTTINEKEDKLDEKKSPLKRSPKFSPSKKVPSKYHGLSQELYDEGICEDDIKMGNCTADNLHDLSDGGSDDNAHSPQKVLSSPGKPKTPNKTIPSSDNEDNDAEVVNDRTKIPVGIRLAGVTPNSPTNTSTGDVGGRGHKRAAPRASCQYGSQCYRRNPQHKEEYAHPGDSDYNDDDDDDEDEDGDDDERPECEFGVDCYRKNPQHRKQFKHTRFPQPQRKAKRKAKNKKRGSDESESDDYDYDDPFLNDDSSDDYAPTDSGSDTNIEDNVEEEDTERMLKEGKKFVKKN